MNRPGIRFLPESDTAVAHAPRWLVVVHNDPVNLMPYVVIVFKKELAMDDDEATKHMLEVHRDGRSVVWSGEREHAEHLVARLQSWHLRTTLDSEDDAL